MMDPVIVSDASPLHYLVLIDAVPLLRRLTSEVLIPPAVARELSHDCTPVAVRHWISEPKSWLKIVAPSHSRSLGLDAGETEAITLAIESNIRSILIDERKGFRVATELGLKPFGLLAVLEFAAAGGWIDLEEYVRRLKTTTFRFHERLISGMRERLARL